MKNLNKQKMMIKNLKAKWLVFLLLLTVIAGCEKKEEKPVKIGVSHCCVTSDSFMWTVAQNIEKTSHENKVNFTLFNAEGSQREQAKQIDTLLKQGADVLLAAIVIDDTVQKPFQRQLLEKAKRKNTPIIFYTITPKAGFLQQYPDSYFVGSVPEQSGIMQGEMIVEQWRQNPSWDKNGDGVIQYVILKGPSGNPDAEGRTKWVQATIKNYPEAGVQSRLLSLKTGDWQRNQAEKIIRDWAEDGTLAEAEMIISNNDDMALGALDAFKTLGVTLPVFGVDALPEALQAIQNGKMSGTVKQDAQGQGQAAVKLANNLAKNRPLDENLDFQIIQKRVIVPYIKIDKKNVASFM